MQTGHYLIRNAPRFRVWSTGGGGGLIEGGISLMNCFENAVGYYDERLPALLKNEPTTKGYIGRLREGLPDIPMREVHAPWTIPLILTRNAVHVHGSDADTSMLFLSFFKKEEITRADKEAVRVLCSNRVLIDYESIRLFAVHSDKEPGTLRLITVDSGSRSYTLEDIPRYMPFETKKEAEEALRSDLKYQKSIADTMEKRFRSEEEMMRSPILH